MARRRKIPDGVRHPATVPQQEATPDEEAVLEVMQTTHVCTRERDMAVIALSYEQIKLYLELHVIAMEPEMYVQQIRNHWRYIDSNPAIYEPDGTPKWRKQSA